MFTGIIREIGQVKGIRRKGDLFTLDISCVQAYESSKLGDSVAVNGVCLTVSRKKEWLSFDVVKNTLAKTNLKRLKGGDHVNIENALRMGEDIGGHMVTGHVDGERKIRKNHKSSAGWLLEISKIPEDRDMLIPKGSVTVDGVSLTVAEDHPAFFRIFLIPFTLKDTTLPEKKIGSYVNIEFDMLGKYAAKRNGVKSSRSERQNRKGLMNR